MEEKTRCARDCCCSCLSASVSISRGTSQFEEEGAASRVIEEAGGVPIKAVSQPISGMVYENASKKMASGITSGIALEIPSAGYSSEIACKISSAEKFSEISFVVASEISLKTAFVVFESGFVRSEEGVWKLFDIGGMGVVSGVVCGEIDVVVEDGVALVEESRGGLEGVGGLFRCVGISAEVESVG